MRSGLVLLTLAGCGRVSFDERSDSRTVDAAFASGPFGPPSPLAEVNTSAVEDDVSLTRDLLEIYFMSNQSSVERPYVAVRARVGDTFGTPVPISELDAPGTINNLHVHPDGLHLVFASGRAPTVGSVDLYEGTRPDRGSQWTVRHIDELATTAADYEPALSEDLLTIYFVQNTTQGDIYMATRTSVDVPFQPPMLISELASPTYDGGPWSTDGGRSLMFHSARNGPMDLLHATRPDASTPFTVSLLAEVNSLEADQDAWLSPDGRTLVFASTRSGNSDLYIATR